MSNNFDLSKLSKKELLKYIQEGSEESGDNLDEPLGNDPLDNQDYSGYDNPGDGYQGYGDAAPEDDNSRWELDTSDVIADIEHALRREKLSRDGTKWQKIPGTKPLLNEKGIADLVITLKSFLNKNNVLGNISLPDAHRITNNISQSLVDLIKYNWDEWDLSKHYFSYLVNLVDSQVFIFLTRPVNAGERKARKKWGEPNSSGGNDKKKGFFF